jgi:hypothetical protein
MSPWFRRRHAETAPARPVEQQPPQPEPEPAEPMPDPTGPLTPERLDRALRRLQQENPPPPEDA